MAKRPAVGKCVHCLRDNVERNWDHVFPESWYPDTTAPDLFKWRVPSCISCNTDLGRVEEDFLRHVGLCLDPDHPASSSIVQKVLRSMKASAGKNEHERRIRGIRAQRMLADALEGDEIPDEGVYPRMGERWGRERQDQLAILIPVESFQRVIEKIVRGIFYLEDTKFIEPPYKINFFASTRV